MTPVIVSMTGIEIRVGKANKMADTLCSECDTDVDDRKIDVSKIGNTI